MASLIAPIARFCGSTPERAKKQVCRTVLTRPGRPASRATRFASMTCTRSRFATICSCTRRGSRSQSSSERYGALRRNVAPSAATSSTSMRVSRSNWWQATNCASSIRYEEWIGLGPKRRCDTVVAWSGVALPMILAEFLFAPTVPSEPRP